jgi:putative ABC transport system permease protein
MGVGADFFITADSVIFNSTGLLFVVLGVFALIRMAGFPDLTVDGSFTIGAALYSVCLVGGWNTPLALLAAGAGGAVGGLLTWTINERLGVGKVVSSVLSMIILVLAAPYVSGGSTKSLLNVTSFHSRVDALDGKLSQAIIGGAPYQAHIIFSSVWLILFGITGGVALVALRTRPGLRLRYIGSAASPTLVPKPERRRLLLFALMAGNATVAIGGAIEAQRRGGFTNNMGTGMLLVALAVLVLGEALLKSFRKREYLRMSEYALAVVLGCLAYSAGIQGLLALRIDFVDLRLLTALFLLLLLGIAGRAHSSSTRLF